MSLLAPGLLWLLPLALATPLAIHYLAKRHGQRLYFPPLFLLHRLYGGSRRFARLRDRLALLCRLLAVALLSLALAGLFNAAGGSDDEPAVIVLDASASMRQTAAGVSAFEAARGLAAGLLDRLAGRPVAVLVAGDRIERSHAQPASGGAAGALIATATPGHGRGSLVQALAEARAMLPDGGHIHLISDTARSALAGVDPGAVEPPWSLTLHRVPAGHANLAVTGIGCRPGVAIAGRPLQLEIGVAHFGRQPVADLRLAVSWADQRQLHPVQVAPGGRQTVTISLTPPRQSELVVTAELLGLDDAIAADDRRQGVIPVVASLPARVYTDGDPQDARRAVRPVLAALQAVGIDARAHPTAMLAELGKRRDLVVTVALAEPIDDAALHAHIADGGAWVHVVSSPADIAQTQAMHSFRAPVELARPIDVSDSGRGFVGLGEADLDHPLLAHFRGREGLLGAVTVSVYGLPAGEPDSEAEVLLAYEDGSPALAARALGAGTALLLNISPDEAQSNLGAIELMPLLMHGLAHATVPRQLEDSSHESGTPYFTAMPVQNAAGRELPLIGNAVLLAEPGLYRRHDGERIAVAQPWSESDTRQLDEATLAALELAAVDQQAGLAAAADRPLWPLLLTIALALFLGETLLMASPPRRLPEVVP